MAVSDEWRVAWTAAAALSMAGSAFVLGSYAFLRQLRSLAYVQIVALLSLCDALLSTPFLFECSTKHRSTCQLEAAFVSFFALGSILWSTSVSRLLHIVVIDGGIPGPNYVLRWHFFVWGLSAACVVPVVALNRYGRAGEWCWIRSDNEVDTILRWVTFYGPAWVAIVYMMAITLAVQGRVRAVLTADVPDSERRREILSFSRRLWLYPLVTIVCWMPTTYYRMQETIQPHAGNPQWVVGIAALLPNLSGFLNALVYGMAPVIYKTVLKHAKNVCKVSGGGGNDLNEPMLPEGVSSHPWGMPSFDSEDASYCATEVPEGWRSSGPTRGQVGGGYASSGPSQGEWLSSGGNVRSSGSSPVPP